MQSLIRAKNAVTDGAVKLAAEIQNASSTIGEEVTTAVSESAETAELVASSVSEMTEAIADAVTKAVSPETLQELADALEIAANDLKELAENTADVGPDFAELASQKYDELVDIAFETKIEIENLTAEVSECLSDSVSAFQSNSWSAARDALDGISKKALQMGLESKLETVQADFLATAGNAGEIARQQAAALSSAQVASIVAEYSESKVDDVINRAVSSVEEVKTFIEQKAQTIFDDLEKFKTTIADIVGGIEAAVEKVSGVFETVDEEIGQSETLLDEILAQLDQQMDHIEAIAETIKQAIESSVAIVEETATEIIESFEDVVADIRSLENQLESIPSRFDEVIAKVDAAISFIKNIDPQIDDFAGKAKLALDGAKTAIGEADGLCDEAIETCTKHIPKAPPLMAARTLFQGVKASIPAIVSSIDSGYGAVDQATGVAKNCLEEAVKAVEVVYPTVEQARKQAINAIELIIEKLEQGIDLIHDGQSTLEGGVQEVARLGEGASGKAIEASSAIQKVKDDAIESAQPQEKLANVRSSYNDSRTACLDKTNEFLETRASQAESGVDELISELERPLQTVYEKIDEVITLLDVDIRSHAKQKISDIQGACTVSLADVVADAAVYFGETPLGKALIERVDVASGQLTEFETTLSQNLGISKDMTIEEALRTAGAKTAVMASETEMGQDLISQVNQAKASTEELISEAHLITSELKTLAEESKSQIESTKIQADAITSELEKKFDEVNREAEALKSEVSEAVNAADAEIARARDTVNQSVESISNEATAALEKAEAQRDAGMSAIKDAVSSVDVAKQQTLSAQAEVFKAESIVEQEVEKAGGDAGSIKQAAVASSSAQTSNNQDASATADTASEDKVSEPTDDQDPRATADAAAGGGFDGDALAEEKPTMDQAGDGFDGDALAEEKPTMDQAGDGFGGDALAEEKPTMDQAGDGFDGDALADDLPSEDQSTESVSAAAQESDASVNLKSQGDSVFSDRFDVDKFDKN